MAAYSTFTVKPVYNYYTHVASASQAFTNYPSLCQIIAVNPANPNQLGIWTKDGGVFNPPWLTNFQPGSTYSVKITQGNSNANIVREGNFPGIEQRTIVGPFAYIYVPENALIVNLEAPPFRNNSSFQRGSNSYQWGPIKNIFTPMISGGQANTSYQIWNRDSAFPFNYFTGLVPGSSYYIDMSDYPGVSITLTFTRRKSYLITEQGDFITTNSGDYITVD